MVFTKHDSNCSVVFVGNNLFNMFCTHKKRKKNAPCGLNSSTEGDATKKSQMM
jgi:hypothetical protein